MSKTWKSHKQSTIVVALVVDQSYAVGAAVTIASLMDHVPADVALEIWLLHIGLNDAQLALISRAVARGAGHLHTFELPTAHVALPIKSDYISRVTFGRLYLGEILPPQCSRVLYLDCDLLVRGDLQDLLSTDLCGRIIAAVPEPNLPVAANPRTYERLNDPRLNPALPYFNAGVLVIDLDSWRRARIGERALSFITRYSPVLMDQDALNAVVSGQWIELDPMWNTSTYWFRSRSRQRRYNVLLHRARIVHYVGHRKPWLRNDIWEAEQWLQYRRQLGCDAPDAIARIDG